MPTIEALSWHPDIAVIERQAHVLPWSDELLLSCFGDAYSNFGVRSPSGELLAFVIIETAGDSWTIMNIATKLSAQRQGLAKRLLQYVQAQAAQHQRDIVLEVRVSNQAAQGLYEGCGFTRIGRRKDYYATPTQQREDALVLRWSGQI